LQQRWGLKYLDLSEIPVLASAVDPRFHSLKFLSDEQKGDVRLEITRLMKQLMDSAALVYITLVQSPRKKTKLHWTFSLVKKVMILVIIVKMRQDSISWRKWFPEI